MTNDDCYGDKRYDTLVTIDFMNLSKEVSVPMPNVIEQALTHKSDNVWLFL